MSNYTASIKFASEEKATEANYTSDVTLFGSYTLRDILHFSFESLDWLAEEALTRVPGPYFLFVVAATSSRLLGVELRVDAPRRGDGRAASGSHTRTRWKRNSRAGAASGASSLAAERAENEDEDDNVINNGA